MTKREEMLVLALTQLLQCVELTNDELELATVEMIDYARSVLKVVK